MSQLALSWVQSWEQLMTAVATFLAVLVALFGERLWRYIDSPKLNVLFDRGLERCFRWAIVPLDEIQDEGVIQDVKRQYFRLRVINRGKGPAKRLKAKVELYTKDNKLAERFEPSLLNWIGGFETIDLAPGEDWYIDFISQVISNHEINRRVRIEIANKKSRGIARDRELSTWILRVSIHGENISNPVIQYWKFLPSKNKNKPGRLIKMKKDC